MNRLSYTELESFQQKSEKLVMIFLANEILVFDLTTYDCHEAYIPDDKPCLAINRLGQNINEFFNKNRATISQLHYIANLGVEYREC